MSEGKLPTTKMSRKVSNQYNTESDAEIYNWILSNCIASPSANNVFICWIPIQNTRGVDYQRQQNQFRFSYKGSIWPG